MATNNELLAAFRQYGIAQPLWRMLLGFAVAEGDNPSGNPTLGFVDFQLPGIGTDLDSHVRALADQLQYRLPVAGPFPAAGSDYDQAKWIAVVVGQVGSGSDWQGNAQPSQERYINSIVSNMPAPQGDSGGDSVGHEHVLNYDHNIVPQETFYDCGPASAQVVLNGRGVIESETDLITAIGTTENGTNSVGLVANALNQQLDDAHYTSVYLENDPPTQQQKDQLWVDITHSIDAGYGVVMNWVAPPSNYPVGVKGSQSPAYGGGTVFHYVPCMGYDDTPGAKALWIADSGFRPFGYWISFEQAASLIPPKGYAYANTAAQPADPIPPSPAIPEGPLMALTDGEQQELLTKTREIWDQLRGPGGNGWPQLGDLTPVDYLAQVPTKKKTTR